MNVAKFFTKDNIVLDLKATNKEEAIFELSEVLKNLNSSFNYDLFIKDVFAREEIQTTAIGNNVAIPHARTEAIDDFCLIFGRTNTGIDFNAIDKKPVKLIFLMGTPKKKALQNYLQILACLTRVLEKESVREKLINVSSVEQIIDIFSNVG